jgi:hypothetical protein
VNSVGGQRIMPGTGRPRGVLRTISVVPGGPGSSPDGEWLTAADMTPCTVPRLVRDGELPRRTRKRYWLMHRSDVDTSVESTRIKAGSIRHLLKEPPHA